ncbi:hypothetical protein [Micromonospora sediminicola]|uniref:hypothetical protein n=1 Tax=Micromonospora sediminicola TaxID=946078 RepID=UPI00379ED97C
MTALRRGWSLPLSASCAEENTVTTEQTWTPLREWEPDINERVVDFRHPDTAGTVLRVDRYGHFADPYWRVTVRWDGGGRVEHGVETTSLTRPDGTQGSR